MENVNIKNLTEISITTGDISLRKDCFYLGTVKYNKELYLLLNSLKNAKITKTKRVFIASKNNIIKYNGCYLNLTNSLIYKYANYIIINPIIKGNDYFIIYEI